MGTTRRKTKPLTTWQFDSKFEQELVTGVLAHCPYHPCKLNYTVYSEATYTPDFACTVDEFMFYIEAKGRFHDRNEANKYLHIRKSLGVFEELVFLFQKPNNPFPGAQKRKDGSRMTHAEWAEKNNFRWFSVDTINQIVGEL